MSRFIDTPDDFIIYAPGEKPAPFTLPAEISEQTEDSVE